MCESKVQLTKNMPQKKTSVYPSTSDNKIYEAKERTSFTREFRCVAGWWVEGRAWKCRKRGWKDAQDEWFIQALKCVYTRETRRGL